MITISIQQLIVTALPIALFLVLSGWWLRDSSARKDHALRRHIHTALAQRDDAQPFTELLVRMGLAAGRGLNEHAVAALLDELGAEGWVSVGNPQLPVRLRTYKRAA